MCSTGLRRGYEFDLSKWKTFSVHKRPKCYPKYVHKNPLYPKTDPLEKMAHLLP